MPNKYVPNNGPISAPASEMAAFSTDPIKPAKNAIPILIKPYMTAVSFDIVFIFRIECNYKIDQLRQYER